MNGKKILVLLALLAVLVGGGMAAYFLVQSNQAAQTFPGDGYVLLSSENAERKQAMFSAGGTWRKSLSDTVVFQDVQGVTTKVSRDSFVHYNNRSMAALTDGVVVSLDNLGSAQMMNHYAVSNAIMFNWNGSEYELGNTQSNLTFRDYIWKLAPDKYMVRSSDIKVHFGENDERPAGSFIEVSYVDNGVILIQTEENLWQTISENCYAVLDNGEIVNLSLRNVSDASGKVLIDFSKIVLNSEDNIEITPLTEALENLTEKVIPHFDITARNGKSGETGQSGAVGTDGVNGDNGAQGSAGSAGAAGSGGSAGKSGTNGAGGYSGFSGATGSAGSGATVPGTVLSYPVFNIKDWNVTATSCSGTIMVTNGDMLVNASGSDSAIYLVDVDQNKKVWDYESTYAFTENSEGFPFSFTNLIPDHSYRLVASAKINTGLPGAVDYMRDFISKTFWTDSVGISLETGGCTTNSVSGYVQRQEYAPAEITSARVYFFKNRDDAYAATAANIQSFSEYEVKNVSLSETNGRGEFTFNTELDRNTPYFVRVLVTVGEKEIMPVQVLQLSTLKQTATVGAPTITPNRDSWGFDLTPGAVYDPDGGIKSYSFYLCAEGSTEVKWSYESTDTRTIKNTITVPIDNNKLLQGVSYEAYTVAYFNDNEKSFSITSSKSRPAQVNGSRMPYVYFVGSGGSSDVIPTTAADSSEWYDEIAGTLIVAPGVNSAHAVLTATQPLEVVVRASGYYYAKYPVYLKGTTVEDRAGTYLRGEVNSDNSVYITLPTDAFKETLNPDGSGAVYGLRPNTQYQVIVTGNLANEGDNAFEFDTRIGSCVVKTPDTVTCRASWQNVAGSGSNAFSTVLKLLPADSEDNNAFRRQMKTLTSLKLTLRDGLAGGNGAERASKTLTQDNFAAALGSAAGSASTLGELMTGNGLTLTESFFDLSAQSLTSSSVNITVDEVYDYTVLPEHRTHQNEYASTGSDDLNNPGPSSVVYRNLFDVENETCDIQLLPAPDAVPEPEMGFSVLEGVDEDGDRRFTDGYIMTPNYLNSGKLARNITFYAFDGTDYYASYPAGQWLVSPEYGEGGSIPLCAVTAVNAENKGKWLGKVTVAVPTSGAMPSVHFVPQTKQKYYSALYPDPVEAAAAVNDYAAGATMDRDGNYLYFFDDNHAAEPSNGHQFVFAWTLTYQSDEATRYYPFSMAAAGGADPAQYAPHSGAQDSPRREPTIYTLPYASDADKTTWGVYVYDPDGCVLRKDGNNAEIFLRSSAVFGTGIGAVTVPVYDTPMTDTSKLLQAPNLVEVPTDGITGSTSIALRVQWYTDVYTENGEGVFGRGVAPAGYTEAALRNSERSQITADGTRVIPYYENLFTFYHDAAEYRESYDTAGVSITMQEEYTDGSSGTINGYRVTATGPTAVFKGSNGIRITFTDAEGKTVSIDEYLDGVDGVDAYPTPEIEDNVTIKCKIYVSRELADLAGKSGVSARASLLYENGSEGFSYCTPDNAVALRSYAALSETGAGRKIMPAGRYVFDTGGSVINRLSTDAMLPSIGSFFHISTNLELDSGALQGNMTVSSTRSNRYLVRSNNVSFDAGQRLGAYSGTMSLVPRQLREAEVANFSVLYAAGGAIPSGSITVPETIPVITYTDIRSNANSITTEFSSSISTVWFLLEKKVGNSFVVQRKDNELWVNDDTGSTNESPNREVLSPGGTGIAFSNLDPNTTYRITGYYFDGVSYRKLNMYDSNGAEIANYTRAVTYDEPSVRLSARYGFGALYSQKRIIITPDITRVANFYYTTELLDRNGSFITYLNSDDYSVLTTYVYEVGSFAPDITDPYIVSRGLTYKSTGFDSGTHALTTGSERVYLETGGTYRVRVRVYDKGKGPAYGGSIDDDLVRSEDGVNNSTASFTVASEPDTVNMTGTYRLEGSGAAAAPTIAFTPAFINKSMTVREGKLAAVVVRSRPTADGYEYTDVTAEAMYAEENAGYLSSNTVQWGANKRIRLTQSADKTFFKRGDTFTCYLYGIRDGASVNTGGVTGANRNSILAGRALEGGTPLTTDAIPVNNGESVLLATQTVTYTSEETSAGRVTVTKEGGDFNVLMENPVRQTSIARIGWSITLTYERGGATGQVTVSSGGSSMEPVPFSLEQVSTNVYQTVLSPELLDLPDGAVVENYTVTLEFYQAVMDDDGLVTGYSTAGIEIVAGNDAVVSGTAEAGMRLTSVLNIDNGGSRRALFASLLAPKAAKSAEPTPSVSPEPTPSASPEPTPSASPEPTPSESPEPTPSVSPEPTPSASPEPTPSESPEPTPSASPEPTPSASPEPTPSASPEPTPSESPEPTPSASEEPAPSTGEEPAPDTGEEQPPDTGGEQEPDAGGDNTEAPQEHTGGTEGGVSEPEEN